jgi:polyhydroxyalkanoate synthase
MLERMLAGFESAFTAMLGAGSASPEAFPHRLPAREATGRAGLFEQTPSEVVYAENKLRLLRYLPSVDSPSTVPLLIVPSPLYRYSILDLVPGASLVAYLIAQGLDVYLVDWGRPGREDRYVTFDQYINGYLRRIVHRVRRQSGQQRINLLGYGLGGTMTAIFTALYSRPGATAEYVANLVLLLAPINFHDDGLLSQWTRKGRFNVDLVVDTMGSMPADLMRASFRMLKPTAQIMQKLTLATQVGDGEAAQDLMALQSWLTDDAPYLGEAYRKYIKDCYQENYLVHGKLVIDGERVDLARISCPLLIVAAAQDRICPPASATVLAELVSSTDKEVLELPGGHISAIAGPRAPDHLWPALAAWLIPRSQAGGKRNRNVEE